MRTTSVRMSMPAASCSAARFFSTKSDWSRSRSPTFGFGCLHSGAMPVSKSLASWPATNSQPPALIAGL